MPQLMRRDMEIKRAHHIPQIGEAGLRKRTAVVHVEHKRTLRAILFACEQRQERRGDWDIPSVPPPFSGRC